MVVHIQKISTLILYLRYNQEYGFITFLYYNKVKQHYSGCSMIYGGLVHKFFCKIEIGPNIREKTERKVWPQKCCFLLDFIRKLFP